MHSGLQKLLSEAKFIRDPKMRKKINMFLEADYLADVTLACRRLGVSRNFYYYWKKKLEASAWSLEALQEESRCPKTSPGKSPSWKEDLVVKVRHQIKDRGPGMIQKFIQREYRLLMHASTIGRILRRKGLLKIRLKKARKKHLKRYSLPNPGDCIQMDVKYIPYRIGSQQYYLFNAIDDCTRWRFAFAYENKGVWETQDFFKKLIQACPFKIKHIQTDHGTEFTNEFLSLARSFKKPPKEHVLDTLCRQQDIIHKLIPVGECELNGKVERSHWTDETDFLLKRKPFKSLKQLQRSYSAWIKFYNEHRMHSAIDYMTPIEMLAFKLNGLKPDWMDLSNDVFAVA